MPSAKVETMDVQGGKKHGEKLAQIESQHDEINQSFLEDPDYDDVEDLAEKLQAYKRKFMENDRDNSGELDEMDLKYMLEKLGQAKTHLELKKMISEVDTTNTGTITYREFLDMMLGKKSSVLKLILMFEEKSKAAESPKGVAPKRDLSSLP